MFGAKIYGVTSTAVSMFTAGAAISSGRRPVPPTNIPYIGDVPVFAVGVGILTVILVREITKANDKSKLWTYNAAVTLFAMVGTVTFIIDHQIGPGNSFWVGGTFGAMGAGTVSLMRSKFMVALLEGIKGGFLRGITTAAAAPDADDETKTG